MQAVIKRNRIYKNQGAKQLNVTVAEQASNKNLL